MKNRLRKNRTASERETPQKSCDCPGCQEAGEFRAPKSREQLHEYYWFCLDHVREYNKSWDYYAGLKPEEIEEAIRRDTTWQRPTWRLGTNATAARAKYGFRIHDPFNVFDEDPEESTRPSPHPPRPEEEAMEVMGLTPPITQDELRTRYRELVKRHHPDINGGAQEAEERFKQISEAYTLLKASLGAA